MGMKLLSNFYRKFNILILKAQENRSIFVKKISYEKHIF